MQRHNSLYASRFSNSRLRGGAGVPGAVPALAPLPAPNVLTGLINGLPSHQAVVAYRAAVAGYPALVAGAAAAIAGAGAGAGGAAAAAAAVPPMPAIDFHQQSLDAQLAVLDASFQGVANVAGNIDAQNAFADTLALANTASAYANANGAAGAILNNDVAGVTAIVAAVQAAHDNVNANHQAQLLPREADRVAKEAALATLATAIQTYDNLSSTNIGQGIAELQVTAAAQAVIMGNNYAPTGTQGPQLAALQAEVAARVANVGPAREARRSEERMRAQVDLALGAVQGLVGQFTTLNNEFARPARERAERETAAREAAERAAAAAAAAREEAARRSPDEAKAARLARYNAFTGGAAAGAAEFAEAKAITNALLAVAPAKSFAMPGATDKNSVSIEIMTSLDPTDDGNALAAQLIPMMRNAALEMTFNGRMIMRVPKVDEIVARAAAVALNRYTGESVSAIFRGDAYKAITPTQLAQYRALFGITEAKANAWNEQVERIRSVLASYNIPGREEEIPEAARLSKPALARLGAFSNFDGQLQARVVTKRTTPPTSGVSGALEAVRSLVVTNASAPGRMRGGNANPHAPLYPSMVMKGGAHPFARLYGGDVDRTTQVLKEKIDRLLARYKQLSGVELDADLKREIETYSDAVSTNLKSINNELETLYNGNNAIARFPPGLGSTMPNNRPELEAYASKISELNKAADKAAKRVSKLTDIHSLIQDLVDKVEAQGPAKFE